MMEANHEETEDGEVEATLAAHMEDVQAAFVAALTSAGVLGKLRAQLRAAAVGVLRNDEALIRASTATASDAPVPSEQSGETPYDMTALLVEDFLRRRKLRQSHGVFYEEANVSVMKSSAHDRFREWSAATEEEEGGSAQPSLLETLVARILSQGLPTQHDAGDAVHPESVAAHVDGASGTTNSTTPSNDEEEEDNDDEEETSPAYEVVYAALTEYEESVHYEDSPATTPLRKDEERGIVFVDRIE